MDKELITYILKHISFGLSILFKKEKTLTENTMIGIVIEQSKIGYKLEFIYKRVNLGYFDIDEDIYITRSLKNTIKEIDRNMDLYIVLRHVKQMIDSLYMIIKNKESR